MPNCHRLAATPRLRLVDALSLSLCLLVSALATAAAPAAAKHDSGQLKVVYKPTREFAELAKSLKHAKLFDQQVADLNQLFAWPRDLDVRMENCGQANAFYDPTEGAIIICYEFVDSEMESLRKVYDDPEDLGEAVVNSTFFVFFHELGHAFIGEMDLPTTGKEEDAVDQLAVVVLVDLGQAGEAAALDGAISFGLLAKESGDSPLWDEHSLDDQRFYNILCWIYGTDAEKYAYLVEKGHLPEARAARCESEFQRLDKAWKALLAPHLEASGSKD